MDDLVQSDDFDAGVAAGVLSRKYVDSALGDLSYDEMSDLAESIATSDTVLSDLLSVPAETVGYIDRNEVRRRLMASYHAQKAVDEVSRTYNTGVARGERCEQQLQDSMVRHSHIAEDQWSRALQDSAAGDDSVVNHIRELYYFE